jgi:hypothetical protein
VCRYNPENQAREEFLTPPPPPHYLPPIPDHFSRIPFTGGRMGNQLFFRNFLTVEKGMGSLPSSQVPAQSRVKLLISKVIII